MTEEEIILTEEDIGASIDPSSWREPVQTFPGLVIASRYRYAPESYKAETEFRPAITEDLPQWNLRIKRLDAVLVTPEGEEVDAIRYGGIDLKKWSPSEGKVVAINPNFAKEHFVMTEWMKMKIPLSPSPVALEGKMFMFNYWPNKLFGKMNSRNVVVPTTLLSPDYVYPQEVQRIPIPAREEGAEESSGTVLDQDAAIKAVLDVLPGIHSSDTQAILEAVPSEARLNAVVTGIVTGTLLEELISDGRIDTDDSGVFVSA